MAKSVIFYGVEIWGWTEEKEVEALQERWVLELDRFTLGYVVREETKRKKLKIEAGRRAFKYEMKIRDNRF